MSITNLKTVQVQRCGVEQFQELLVIYRYFVMVFTAEEREDQSHISSQWIKHRLLMTQ